MGWWFKVPAVPRSWHPGGGEIFLSGEVQAEKRRCGVVVRHMDPGPRPAELVSLSLLRTN